MTTPYEHLAKQVADLYGGQVVAWTDGPRAGEWLVDTQVRELAIYLPPSPLGNTPVYELWDGQQMVRTCSGAELPAAGGPGGGCWTTLPTGPDGPEEVESNCLCREAGELACKPTTRLDVVLAGVDFAGERQDAEMNYKEEVEEERRGLTPEERKALLGGGL